MVLFDCDGTLWSSQEGEYISSVESSLKKVNGITIIRQKDNKTFTLKNGVLKAFGHLKKLNGHIIIGVVSDNRPKPLITALKLFKIWPFIHQNAFKVRLWRGYCPKHKMILEILNQKEFANVSHGEVFWIDDKDYAKKANKMGVNFILVNARTDLLKVVEGLFKA